MAQSAIQKCDICQSARGSEYCLDCKQQFCTSCKSSHLRIAVCRNHKFTDSHNATSDSQIFCQEHNDVYVFYCDECHTPVCKICVVKTHKGHTMTDIDELVCNKKSHFQKEVKRALETDDFQNVESKIAEHETKLATDVSTASAAIRLDGETFKAYIDAAVNSLLAQIDERFTIENAALSVDRSKVREAVANRNLLRQKMIEMSTMRNDIGLLEEIPKLENVLINLKSLQLKEPYTIIYQDSNISRDAITKCFGKVEFIKLQHSITETKIYSGEIFDDFLRQGSGFRQKVRLLEQNIKTAGNSIEQRLVKFYQMQLINKLNTISDPKIIKVFVGFIKGWKDIVLECIRNINTAAPGLLLQSTEDLTAADVSVVDNKEYPDCIDLSWEESGGRVCAEIRLGLNDKPEQLAINAVTFEILAAVGFNHEMMSLHAILTGTLISDTNKDLIANVDPFSILLSGSHQAIDESPRGFLFRFSQNDIEMRIGLSELDKVVLNLLFPPCMTSAYRPHISSETKMIYCGRRVMENHNKPLNSMTDGRCGPTDGANCPACRTLIDDKYGKLERLIAKGHFQGWSGLIYCYKKTTRCGPNYGYPCQSCYNILNS